mmetsp:Transcript_116893/g.372188  ORF Transcript_116893/g.372188 Transcript_116893/m.372188 type:complete len:267 (+) Transcript_116893:413-1213(+)
MQRGNRPSALTHSSRERRVGTRSHRGSRGNASPKVGDVAQWDNSQGQPLAVPTHQHQASLSSSPWHCSLHSQIVTTHQRPSKGLPWPAPLERQNHSICARAPIVPHGNALLHQTAEQTPRRGRGHQQRVLTEGNSSCRKVRPRQRDERQRRRVAPPDAGRRAEDRVGAADEEARGSVRRRRRQARQSRRPEEASMWPCRFQNLEVRLREKVRRTHQAPLPVAVHPVDAPEARALHRELHTQEEPRDLQDVRQPPDGLPGQPLLPLP